MPNQGTYGFYEHLRPTKGPEIFKSYEKTKLLEQRAKREDDKLDLAKRIKEQEAKKANEIKIKAVDEFNAFAGRTGATAQRLTSQAGQILVGAKKAVDAGYMTKDQYTQYELNLQGGVHAYNEVSNTRKAEYDELMALDKNDYRDGELEKAQEQARKSFMRTVDVHFNNDGTLYFQGKDGEKQSVGEFYSSTEMPSMIDARHNILGQVREGIKEEITNQLLEQDPNTGLWYAKEIRGNDDLSIKIMADANISSHDSGGIARQSGYNYENKMIANGYPELNDNQLEELEKEVQIQTDDEVYSLYSNAANNEAWKRNEAIRKSKKDTKQETYYPALTETTVYKRSYGDEGVEGRTATIDVSKIKGAIAKEQVIGQVVEMKDGNPIIDKGSKTFRIDGNIPETKGMLGQVKQVIRLDGDVDENDNPYYYVEMVSVMDRDFTAALSGMNQNLMNEMLRKYKNKPVMLRLNEQQMKTLQGRIPNILDVFEDQGGEGDADDL